MLAEKDIMHRDLKPENLMMVNRITDINMKIVDFGLSSFINIDEYLYSRCGTPGYVAPEVIDYVEGDKFDDRVDVFSAGVMFYIL